MIKLIFLKVLSGEKKIPTQKHSLLPAAQMKLSLIVTVTLLLPC